MTEHAAIVNISGQRSWRNRLTNPPARRQTAAGASRVAAVWRGLRLTLAYPDQGAGSARRWAAEVHPIGNQGQSSVVNMRLLFANLVARYANCTNGRIYARTV